MKLSEIRGERVFDVIADIIEPVARIAKDAQISAAIKQYGNDSGEAAVAVLPLIIKEHRGDVVTILASIKGVSCEQYLSDVSFATLMKDASDVLTDTELLSFLG